MTESSARQTTLRKALQACLVADVSLCEEVFTHDVTCASPVLRASSRDELETKLSSRADALANIEVVVDRMAESADTVVAEWTVAADHVRPFVVPGDTALRPGGRRISLSGTTEAVFRGARICAIRHDFDEAALLAALGVADR
jgi:hypothetical protein